VAEEFDRAAARGAPVQQVSGAAEIRR